MLLVSLFQNTSWIKGKKWTQKINKWYPLTWNFPVSPIQLSLDPSESYSDLMSDSEPIECKVSHDVDNLPDSEII